METLHARFWNSTEHFSQEKIVGGSDTFHFDGITSSLLPLAVRNICTKHCRLSVAIRWSCSLAAQEEAEIPPPRLTSGILLNIVVFRSFLMFWFLRQAGRAASQPPLPGWLWQALWLSGRDLLLVWIKDYWVSTWLVWLVQDNLWCLRLDKTICPIRTVKSCVLYSTWWHQQGYCIQFYSDV